MKYLYFSFYSDVHHQMHTIMSLCVIVYSHTNKMDDRYKDIFLLSIFQNLPHRTSKASISNTFLQISRTGVLCGSVLTGFLPSVNPLYREKVANRNPFAHTPRGSGNIYKFTHRRKKNSIQYNRTTIFLVAAWLLWGAAQRPSVVRMYVSVETRHDKLYPT